MEVPKYYYLSNAVIEGNTYTYVHQNTSLADRLPFRIGGLGRIVHSRGFFNESYKQGNFVLYCILSGEGTLEYDGRTYLIKPGDFMFLDRDLRLAMYTGTQLDAYFIHCNGTSCKDYYNACYHGNFRPVTQSRAFSSPRYFSIFNQRMRKIFRGDGYFNLQSNFHASDGIVQYNDSSIQTKIRRPAGLAFKVR